MKKTESVIHIPERGCHNCRLHCVNHKECDSEWSCKQGMEWRPIVQPIEPQEPKQHVFLIHQDGNTARLYKDGVKVSPKEFTTFYGCKMTPEQEKLLRIAQTNYMESIQPKQTAEEILDLQQYITNLLYAAYNKEMSL